MILIENRKILQTHFPKAWNQLMEKELHDHTDVRVEVTKDGNKTIAVQVDSGWNYIHSKYNPVAEAERFVHALTEIDESHHILFYGVGLGYHIDEFLKKYPNVTFSIYEPNIYVITKFLSLVDLNKWQPTKRLLNIMIDINGEALQNNLLQFTRILDKEVKTIIFNSYDRIYPNEAKMFVEVFRKAIFENREIMHSKIAFSKREAFNGLKNVPYMLTSPNILHGHNQMFKDKPAIIVAAGPSLNMEYENLKKVKAAGSAYIFSVGSAINSLIANGIYPDAAFSYDGSEANSMVFKKIIDENIADVPLIFGSTIGYETLEQYTGQLVNFFVRHHSTVEMFLKRKNGESIVATDRLRTISSITMQVLISLDFSPIILVGQNLGYLGDEFYAKGIEYINPISTQGQIEAAVRVKDVYGQIMLSSRGHTEMRNEMESFISSIQPVRIINATKGGANIEGTEFMPFEDVISGLLTKPSIVDTNWLEQLQADPYDLSYFKQQQRHLEESCDDLMRIFKRFTELLEEMNSFVFSKNEVHLEKAFNRFDKLFDRLQQNQVNLLIIQRMNSIGFEIVMKVFEEVRFQTNAIEKAEKVVKYFRNYLENCIFDTKLIREAVKEMYARIQAKADVV
ncbi:motility associated factor glycosyltransferase family protein [Brevibacillus reuszeri]|uniref:motility associated factor glycosyltransferase family protein n=1 Tax=Brevibacillus reuszeri TaxID=54915 RepID=UPI003D25E84F